MIPAVVLAAGLSRRMGRPKLLLPLGEKTVVERVVEGVAAAGVEEILVVVGAYRADLERVLRPYGVRLIFNPRYGEGIGTSVAAGAAAVAPPARGILFVAGDQPLVSPEFLKGLLREFKTGNAPMVCSERGIPAVFPIRLRPELMSLTGDRGGRQLLEKYRVEVVTVTGFPDWMLLDVDTPEDYRQVRKLWEKYNGS